MKKVEEIRSKVSEVVSCIGMSGNEKRDAIMQIIFLSVDQTLKGVDEIIKDEIRKHGEDYDAITVLAAAGARIKKGS